VDIQTKRGKWLVISLFRVYSEPFSVDLHQIVPQLLVYASDWGRFHNPI
jgi:hypothetical protein